MRSLSAPIASDGLSDVLHGLRLQTTIFCRSELRSPWGFAVDSRDFASFHLVTKGSAWLDVDPPTQRFRLSEGDLVILPHGNTHVVRDAPSSAVTRLDTLIADSPLDRGGRLVFGGSGPATTLLCGGFRAEGGSANRCLSALPSVVHLRGAEYDRKAWLSVALRMLTQEAKSKRPGANAVVVRLAEMLFVEAVRSHLATSTNELNAFRAGVTDPRIGAALSAVHRQPSALWTLDGLSRRAAMSRTAFAMRFREIVGMPPLTYVADCRMHCAADLLRSTHLPLSRIAERCGYRSDSAFSRAFRRWSGQTPAAFRAGIESAERVAEHSQLYVRRNQANAQS